MKEYKCKCDNCLKSGNSTFARLFFKKVEDKWVYLCSIYWEKF